MRFVISAVALFIASASALAAPPSGNAPVTNASGEKRVLPDKKEATAAIVKLLDMADMQPAVVIKIGTCIAALDATHAGQVACTVAVIIGASTSETQADFYRVGSMWVAQPSSSQDSLPFPDPAL